MPLGLPHTVLAAQNGVSCYLPGKFLMQVSTKPSRDQGQTKMLPPVAAHTRLSGHLFSCKAASLTVSPTMFRLWARALPSSL